MPRKNRSVTRRATSTFAGIQRGPVEFSPDYTNVKHDLRRIGILAVSFFALLIVLSFFLR